MKDFKDKREMGKRKNQEKRAENLRTGRRPDWKVSGLREKRPGINVIERKEKMNGVSTDMVLTENRNYRHPLFTYAKVLLGHDAKAHFSHTCSRVHGEAKRAFRLSRFAK